MISCIWVDTDQSCEIFKAHSIFHFDKHTLRSDAWSQLRADWVKPCSLCALRVCPTFRAWFISRCLSPVNQIRMLEFTPKKKKISVGCRKPFEVTPGSRHRFTTTMTTRSRESKFTKSRARQFKAIIRPFMILMTDHSKDALNPIWFSGNMQILRSIRFMPLHGRKLAGDGLYDKQHWTHGKRLILSTLSCKRCHS